MFKHSAAFSTFSVDDVPRAKQFYVDSLGLSVTEEMGGLRLHLPEGVEVFVYPKPDHKAANFTVLNFIVDDIDVAVQELIRFALEVLELLGDDRNDVARNVFENLRVFDGSVLVSLCS